MVRYPGHDSVSNSTEIKQQRESREEAMIVSSAKLEAGIFLMDQGKFRQYKWH
jgi:hypothetical protein